MNIIHEDQVKSQRLKHAIVCLDVRELLGIELQDLLSEPAELVGEFSEESDIRIATKHSKKHSTDDANTQVNRFGNHTKVSLYYFHGVQRHR